MSYAMSKVRRRRRVGTGKVKIRMSGFRIVVDVWMSGFSMRKELYWEGTTRKDIAASGRC